MPKVFLSHSSRDKTSVIRLAKDLQKRGVEVWLDEWNIRVGESISHSVESGINESDFLVVWLSRSAIESGWVDREWRTKVLDEISDKRTSVLPILAEDIEIPGLLRDKKYADFRRDYDIGLRDLLKVPGLCDRPLRIGEHLYQDLVRLSERLTSVLVEHGVAINEIWLTHPPTDRWFPYRPDGLQPWTPTDGSTWKDHPAELGICHASWYYGDNNPHLMFRWSDKSEPWAAINAPYDDPDTVFFTLDGLVYVKENAHRLIYLTKQHLNNLKGKGLLVNVGDLPEKLDDMINGFLNAGPNDTPEDTI
jgi:hypothetical protein